MVPKQIKEDDSGIHLLLTMQYFVFNREELDEMEKIVNRKKLNIFNRTDVFRMRKKIWNLFVGLSQESTEK